MLGQNDRQGRWAAAVVPKYSVAFYLRQSRDFIEAMRQAPIFPRLLRLTVNAEQSHRFWNRGVPYRGMFHTRVCSWCCCLPVSGSDQHLKT